MKAYFKKVNLEIAITHILSRKKQSAIAMMGVMFGISMFITMISFMTGVNDFLMELTLEGSPHIRIYNPITLDDEPLQKTAAGSDMTVLHHVKSKNELPKIKDGLRIVQQLEKREDIALVSPQVTSQTFFNNGPTQLPGIVVGVDFLKEDEMYGLRRKMKTGVFNEVLTYNDAILLGKGLAAKLGVEPGDRISITTPTGAILMMRVTGTFGFGLASVDDSRSYASIQTVQKIMGTDPSYITDIHIKMVDHTAAKPLATQLASQYGYHAEDWEDANEAILVGEKIRNTMTYIVSITMLVVAGFGIYNIMNMSIINKMKDIAILKATGFDGNDVTSIFLNQAMMIGLLGGVLGVITGYGLSSVIDNIPFDVEGFIDMDTFPVSFHTRHYVMGILFGVLTTLFAGWFPSRKAARLDPVEIIRG